MTDLKHMVGVVEPRTRFPGFAEMEHFVRDLALSHPAGVTVEVIGESGEGNPIRSVTVGDGARHAIVIGNPHPNEPVGLVTIQHLLTRLCEDPDLRAELGFTWHVVPCIDPDGTQRNEGWYSGPITRGNYARHFYRPSADEQAEWTFPVEWAGKTFGDPLPETSALMALIDSTRPDFLVSLHNGEINRGFYYVSGGDDEYFAELAGLLTDAGIAVEAGLADGPGATRFAPGVFGMGSFGAMYEAMSVADPAAADGLSGGSPGDYSEKYGTKTLVCEVPLWAIPQADDDSPSGESIRMVLHDAADTMRKNADTFSSIIARLSGKLPEASPYYRAITKSLPRWVGIFDAKATMADGEEDRIASRSEEITERHLVPEMLTLRLGGQLLRLFDEADPTAADAEIQGEKTAFSVIFDRWCAEVDAHRPGVQHRIASLVEVQVGAILLAITRVRDGLPA